VSNFLCRRCRDGRVDPDRGGHGHRRLLIHRILVLRQSSRRAGPLCDPYLCRHSPSRCGRDLCCSTRWRLYCSFSFPMVGTPAWYKRLSRAISTTPAPLSLPWRTRTPVNGLGSARCAFCLSPAVRVISASQRAEFCRFLLPQNDAFDCSRQRQFVACRWPRPLTGRWEEQLQRATEARG
jgi:hypothetical protein